MDVVNITGIEPRFFITVALFVLFILSMLAMGVLRLFQQRGRSAALFFALGAAGIVLFAIALNAWLV